MHRSFFREKISEMQTIDSIVFVDTIRGEPDRGWPHQDVQDTLVRAGVQCHNEFVSSASALEELAQRYSHVTFWPLNHTFGSEPDGLMLVTVLDQLGKPYLACNPRGARYTSKLLFKAALRSCNIETPPWVTLSNPFDLAAVPFSEPMFVKTEYSCDSEGVRRVNTLSELTPTVAGLRQKFIDAIFAEPCAGNKELTVACIMAGTRLLTAAMRMKAVQADYIDIYAKHHNDALSLEPATKDEQELLGSYARRISERLLLTGYFRVDFILNDDGIPRAIDLNILPFLSSNPDRLSYLPMAFMMSTGCSYNDVIGAVVNSACAGSVSIDPRSPLGEFTSSSALLSGEIAYE